jgi:hypothetical protein
MDALTLLARAHEAGLAVAIAGGKLVVRGPRQAEPMVRLLAEHKPVVMSALAADWRTRHREALARWNALHRPEDATRLAWGELLSHWHRLHGRRAPEWQCAECGRAIAGLTALTLADGNRVHLDGLDCLLAFGKRWRNEAAGGLRSLGLDPPPGFELL